LGAVCCAGFVLASSLAFALPDPVTPPAILQDLRSFREVSSVLYVAAHPDDENTQLITYLARGRGSRMAYLSVTRGDGGQNLLGPEFGQELGVIRTQELLAARRLDGGRQFFTRALDFGFSKDYREAIRIWDRDTIVCDIVRIIRTFHPDVVITRFPTTPGGHGHHTASAVLAVEAFKLAGDPTAFPDQLGKLTPWKPKRILMNSGGGRGGGGDAANSSSVRMDDGGNDPVTEESFASIAGRSRAMHKSQGFGNFGGGGGGPRSESFTLLDGASATNTVFDAIDTTWNRFAGGAEIDRLCTTAIDKFNSADPSASVPALITIKRALAALPTDPVIDDKRSQLDRILQECLGLTTETTVASAEVVPGETLKMHHTATILSSVPVKWVGVHYPGSIAQAKSAIDLKPGQAASLDESRTLPKETPLSQPYWLREESLVGSFRVADASLIGRPENPPSFPIGEVFEVMGQTLVVPDEPIQPGTPFPRRLDVISPVSLKFASEVRLFAPGTQRPVEVQVLAARPSVSGTVQLEVPSGWKVVPETQPFKLSQGGDYATVTFMVTAPPQPAKVSLSVKAQINDATYTNDRLEIKYPHIPLQLLQPDARLKAVSLNLAIRGQKIGYLPGAGDNVAECLEQMGYSVRSLTGTDLTVEKLREFDAVVVGIRAFDTRKDLATQLPALFAYVEAGGNVVMQYNRVDGLLGAPLTLRISQGRVTDETAPVTFLAPDHPALTTPNKITSADFDGWVQERGIYFPGQWDDRFVPILACGDPGEAQLKSGLLVAQYGKGYFTYTGLVFFRELPEGVPGACRLFANLVSLGK
jgi:LmbE family N-acetylglucosaminyl deacetylase